MTELLGVLMLTLRVLLTFYCVFPKSASRKKAKDIVIIFLTEVIDYNYTSQPKPKPGHINIIKKGRELSFFLSQGPHLWII